jgi:hypothetical protein
MRVAHVIQRTVPAPLLGSETHMYALSKALTRRNHDITILTSMALDIGAFYSVKQGIKSFKCLKIIEELMADEDKSPIRIVRFPIHYELRYIFKILKGINGGALKSSSLEHLSNIMLSGPLVPDIYFYILVHDYDVVHAMTFPYSHIYFAFKATKTRKAPFVITPLFHYKLSEYYNPYLIDVLRKADATIALTNFEKSYFSN